MPNYLLVADVNSSHLESNTTAATVIAAKDVLLRLTHLMRYLPCRQPVKV